MALTIPTLYSLSAFDATQSATFTFNVRGGDQVVKNELIISRQSDNVVVYDQIQTTFAFRHILPANTLTNGVYYSAILKTYNANNDVSSDSNRIQFYCFSTPSFSFSNIPIGNVINNATYEFEVEYDQNENEKLNSYTFNLYDDERSLLITSNIQYAGSSSSVPMDVYYTFAGMKDQTTYYVQATGTTAHGMSLNTGLILITIQYEVPNVFSVVELSNNCEGGYITIQSNLIEIDGTSNPSPPTYVDENTAVDVTGTGEYVLFNEGFNVTDNFTASLWGKDFNINSTIITMKDKQNTFTVTYRQAYPDSINFVYAELKVTNEFFTYIAYTDNISVDSTDNLQIWIRKVNGLYDVGLYILSS